VHLLKMGWNQGSAGWVSILTHVLVLNTCVLPAWSRCEDLGPKERALRTWHRVLMILPPDLQLDGTWKEPANVDCYMLPVLWDLQRLGPRPSDFTAAVSWPANSVPVHERGAQWHPAAKQLCMTCLMRCQLRQVTWSGGALLLSCRHRCASRALGP
jgi:hypothetical protein